MSKDWDPNLTPEQNYILKQEGTESPGSSPLNHEKREGTYHCVGCGIKLFESSTKYESGTGWPSFFDSVPDVFEVKTDTNIGYPRTEYHCKKCDFSGTKDRKTTRKLQVQKKKAKLKKRQFWP